MAEVFGTVSAIVGVVQFGLSVANTLQTYIGDYQHASQDVTTLAHSLTAIYENVKELRVLLIEDGTTHGFTSGGRYNANICLVETAKLTERLWKTIRKTHVGGLPLPNPSPTGDLTDVTSETTAVIVQPEQIDFSVFNRLQWPFSKPDIDKRKAELNYLDLKILLVKKEYTKPGLADLDRDQTEREKRQLKKSKARAKEALEAIKAENAKIKQGQQQQLRKSSLKTVGFNPQVQTKERTPSLDNASNRSSRRSSNRHATGTPDTNHASIDNRDNGGYDADYGELRADTLTEDILFEVVSRMTPQLRQDILLEIEQENRAKEGEQERKEAEIKSAVQLYKAQLVEELQKSKQESERLKRQLIEAFEGKLTEQQVVEYVQSQQVQNVQNDEVAQLLNDLGVHDIGTPVRNTEEQATVHFKGKRGFLSFIKTHFRGRSKHEGSASDRRLRRLRSRSRSPASARNSSPSSTYVTNSSRSQDNNHMKNIRVFSVVVSLDGDRRTASHIMIPTPWLQAILIDQDRPKWWKARMFKETMRVYTGLDYYTRQLVEVEAAAKEGVAASELTLLYARRLDQKKSKARKMLDATLLASEPWDFIRGRVLLIYEINQERNEWERGHDVDSWIAGDGRGHEHRSRTRDYTTSLDFESPPDGYRANARRDVDLEHDSRPHRNKHYPTEYDEGYAAHSHGPPWQSPHRRRPTYTRVHRKYMSRDTLSFYGLPWEYDPQNEDFIIILRELTQREADILFEHSRQSRWERRSDYNSRTQSATDKPSRSTREFYEKEFRHRNDSSQSPYPDNYDKIIEKQEQEESERKRATRFRSTSKIGEKLPPQYQKYSGAFSSEQDASNDPKQRQALVEMLTDIGLRTSSKLRSRARTESLQVRDNVAGELDDARERAKKEALLDSGLKLEILKDLESRRSRVSKSFLPRSFSSETGVASASHRDARKAQKPVRSEVPRPGLQARSSSLTKPSTRDQPKTGPVIDSFGKTTFTAGPEHQQGNEWQSRDKEEPKLPGLSERVITEDDSSDMFESDSNSDMSDDSSRGNRKQGGMRLGSRRVEPMIGNDHLLTESPVSISEQQHDAATRLADPDAHTPESDRSVNPSEAKSPFPTTREYTRPYLESAVDDDSEHAGPQSLAQGSTSPRDSSRSPAPRAEEAENIRTETDDDNKGALSADESGNKKHEEQAES